MNTSEKLNLAEIRDITIESGLQLIPGVGGALSTVYFGTKQAKEFKRLEKFYKVLSEELESIKGMIVAVENQYEDGLISLIEQVNDKVEKEHQEVKINAYRDYMKNLLTNNINSYNYDKKKLFLDILGNMNNLEIEVLNLIYQKYIENPQHIIKVGTFNRPDFDVYVFVGIISRLKSYGFIKSTSGEINIGGGVDNSLEEWISISNFGLEFVNFVLK